MPESKLRVRFIADPEFAAWLKAESAASTDLTIESERSERDASQLGFDLATAVSLVAVAKGAMDAATFAAKVYAWWSERKKKPGAPQKIVLQTPLKTLELHSNSEITQDDIRAFLQAATVTLG